MIQTVSLFSKRDDFLNFIALSLFVLTYSLLIEHQNYKNLTRFDSDIITATVLSQYTKTKDGTKYQVLKMRSDNGVLFYTSAKSSLKNIKGKKIDLKIWAGKKSFYEYLRTFYAYTKIIYIHEKQTLKQILNDYIQKTHENDEIANIYKALYSATPMSQNLYTSFSTLGVSHLLAISGFHLGVLSGVLFFLLKYPYKILQNRYFPYRNFKIDIFIVIAIVLLFYLLFLDSPPSLMRAYWMLIIGFVLYDRGITIISMQTLLLSIILLLAFFPKLFFALGFWLSVCGVFYIFLFLIHFKHLSKIWQFVLVPFWVYLLMLPYSLAIFESFSIYHPLSIIWTSLFSIFYPLSIVLHIIGLGSAFDSILESFISLGEYKTLVALPFKWLFVHILLSLLSIHKKLFLWMLLLFNILIFIFAIYKTL